MKAQWLDVWCVGYQVKRVTVDEKVGRATGEEWSSIEEESVLGTRDGASAAARLKEALLDMRFERDPELKGKPMHTDFRLVSLTHKGRAALFPGVLKGQAEKGEGKS